MLACVLLFSISAFLSLSLLLHWCLCAASAYPISGSMSFNVCDHPLSLPLLCYCSLFFSREEINPQDQSVQVSWIKHCRISGDVFTSVSSQKCSTHSGYVQWIICTTMHKQTLYTDPKPEQPQRLYPFICCI